MQPLNSTIKKENFNIRPDSHKDNYRLANFRCSDQQGWYCRVEAPDGTTLLSAALEYVLIKVVEREYPIGLTNLNFAFAKIGLPEITTVPSQCALPDLRTWVEKIEDTIRGLKRFLPNLRIESLLRGKNFVVIRCSSKKQAKKVMKAQVFRRTGKHTDRRGAQIMIREIT
jgi:hypothetical protein